MNQQVAHQSCINKLHSTLVIVNYTTCCTAIVWINTLHINLVVSTSYTTFWCVSASCIAYQSGCIN